MSSRPPITPDDADEATLNVALTGAGVDMIPKVPTLSPRGIVIMALLLMMAGRRLVGESGSIII